MVHYVVLMMDMIYLDMIMMYSQFVFLSFLENKYFHFYCYS